MHWSMYQRKRAAILPGEPFRLRVQTRPLEPAPVEVCGRELAVADCLELAAASAWLMVRLGGIGARARRCAGTMAGTVEPEGWPDGLPPLTSGARTTAELAVELSDGIRQLRRRTGWQAGPPTTPSEFDILHPDVCEIHLADRTFPNWWEAVDWIGQAFLAFRKAQVDDASGVAGLLARGRLAVRTVQRAVLGLPIVFFFKSMFQSMTDSGMDPREARRRASAGVSPRRGMARGSPLMFRVVRLAGPSPAYAVMMTLFRSQFLPDGAISIRPQQRGMRSVEAPAPADYRLVAAWFDYVRGEHAPLLPVSVSQ